MARYKTQDIKLILSDLRSKVRNGVITISYTRDGVNALRNAVISAFDNREFSSEHFNPQTLLRFDQLFDVPNFPRTSVSQISATKWPTADETAWALQNFINRRAEPWSHVRIVQTVDLDAEALAQNATLPA